MKQIEEFLNQQHKMGKARKGTYREAIMAFEKISKIDFETVYLDRKIVNDTLADLTKKSSTADSTWNKYLACYKRYAKWLYDPDDENFPIIWKKIEPKRIDWEKKLNDKWLTEKEFYDLLAVTDSLCLRALFCTTVSGGLRAGEVLGCRIGSVEVAGSECSLTVTGKTGTRSFVMNQFAPALIQWLNFHPLRFDKKAPLWTRQFVTKYNPLNKGLKLCHVNRLLLRYCQAAGIDKPVSMHWLRHTKVTWVARNRKLRVNDKQANAMFGWSSNSNMYNKYTHLAATDTVDTFRLLEGIEPSEKVEDRDKILQRRQCLGCNEWNLAGSLYCFKCGLPLTEEEAEKQKLIREMTEEVLKAHIKNKKS